MKCCCLYKKTILDNFFPFISIRNPFPFFQFQVVKVLISLHIICLILFHLFTISRLCCVFWLLITFLQVLPVHIALSVLGELSPGGSLMQRTSQQDLQRKFQFNIFTLKQMQLKNLTTLLVHLSLSLLQKERERERLSLTILHLLWIFTSHLRVAV